MNSAFQVLRFIFAALLPAMVAVFFYVLFYKTNKFKNFPTIYKQIIVGVVLGGMSIVGYYFGIEIMYADHTYATMGNSTVAPTISGLMFGWPAALITSIIGAVFRISVGDYMRYSVFFSILLSGLIASLANILIFKKKMPKWYYASLIGIFVECFNFILVFLFSTNNISHAYNILKNSDYLCIISTILSNGIAFLLVNIINHSISFKSSKGVAAQIQQRLFLSTLIALAIVVASTSITMVKKSDIDVNTDLATTTNDVVLETNDQGCEKVKTIAHNRHIHETGYVVIIDLNDGTVLSVSNEIQEKHHIEGTVFVTNLGESILDFEKYSDGKSLFVINYLDNDCLCNYKKCQDKQHAIMSLITTFEVYSGVGISTRVALYTEFIIFILLYGMMNFFVDRIIVSKIYKVNESLEKIMDGNLEEKIEINDSHEFELLTTDINLTVGTLKNYAEEVERRIEGDLELANHIQHGAVPTLFPFQKEYDIYATMQTAKEVGGDFYDYFKLSDNRILFLIADVSGKGIPAAMFMMRAITLIKSLSNTLSSLADIANRTNAELCSKNDAGLFVTAWLGVLDIQTGELEFVNAGHCMPLLYHNHKWEYLKTKANLVFAAIDGYKFRSDKIKLDPDDLILLYTDGVTEATSKDKELYGEPRLLEYVSKNEIVNVEHLLDLINQDVMKFQKGVEQFDDITMIGLRYFGVDNNRVKDELTVKAKEENLSAIINFVHSILAAKKVDINIISSISLAIEEVYMNIVNYAYKSDNKGDVKVRVCFLENAVEIVFTDNGMRFDPTKIERPKENINIDNAEIGLGMLLVRKNIDEINYEYINNQNVLHLKKMLIKEEK